MRPHKRDWPLEMRDLWGCKATPRWTSRREIAEPLRPQGSTKRTASSAWVISSTVWPGASRMLSVADAPVRRAFFLFSAVGKVVATTVRAGCLHIHSAGGIPRSGSGETPSMMCAPSAMTSGLSGTVQAAFLHSSGTGTRPTFRRPSGRPVVQ